MRCLQALLRVRDLEATPAFFVAKRGLRELHPQPRDRSSAERGKQHVVK
jgi:hypothetical protein